MSEFKKNELFTVSCGFFPNKLLVCLDEHLSVETLRSLDLGPETTFVCLDAAISDEAKVKLTDKGCLEVI